MERVIYFVYSATPGARPLDEGSALYARVFESEYRIKDYRWDTEANEWIRNNYLGFLTTIGSPDLDNVAEADLPAQITRF